ncbi:MAG: transcription termination factor NusA [Chloroflexi bacterium]|nr:transcription termination factor NusA [Chloroflexota bacterium]MCI0575128.1 transcription termination factor NusA [Chloroflexota bacterium]MCI0646277.1 transcription termination factor NusA [Chloroflexota bacterium]MCI0728622.1 transcription termination factor NusA [Chloroflexota bacterium]
MKSEFMMAFNEICEERGLSKEVVIDALKTALVSAYRRNTNVSNTQEVVAEIDQRTGEPTIFAEKEVVDALIDSRTEVLIQEAKRAGFTEAEIGDMVMMESTPENFGRIAAQTAKQVILQRVREAEREKLYEDFSAREGEIINGTVQSVSGQNITIGLGRTEAVLPKSQQVGGERYRAHDKIRVYVLEVRRTSRGPQIIVSRNHRSLLRRLLELEVPEIYNGQVEIKSIAREAGARSKVAVVALQPGIDPVGACVGMRGVRIQSIVRELNDEKIDVIEWDPDQKTFIAKALSPARVSQVFLEDHPDEGKTAVVIVPDDQLSLAIGREGQNARLAAKLTGWRIDIKSLTEAAEESLGHLKHPSADPVIVKNKELVGQVELILAKKAANRPITSEDYSILNRLVAGVIGRIITTRAGEFEQIQKARAKARKSVPEYAWNVPLGELGISTRVATLLEENNVKSLGDILLKLELSENTLLAIEGFGDKALEEVREAITAYNRTQAAGAAPAVTEVEAPPEAAPALVAEEELVAEPAAEEEEVVPVEPELVAVVEAAVPAEVAEEPEEVDFEAAIDDLARPLVSTDQPKKQEKKQIVVARPTRAPFDEEEESLEAARRQKSKELVFDEKQGKVVTKRKRKGSRRRPEWETYEEDLDEL